MGSTDDDGYHYFHTYNGDDDRGYGYGGIISTTDLGAPLANSGVAAVWTGYFSHYSDITDRNAEFYVDFTAGTVGFANATGDGVEVKTFADNFGGSSDFQLDGQFGSPHSLATGQLGGTVSRIITGPNDSYDILGLIGIEGAVAVFIDFDKNTAGGFTVSNPSDPSYCTIDAGACRVNYADWVNSFAIAPATAPDTPPTENQFLQGTDTTLPTADLTIAGGAVTTLDLDTATFDGVALGGQAADGVGFFQSNYYFAGLLSDTDLGEPLDAGSPKAYWNGQFQTVGALPVNTDFTLEVDFNADISVDRSVGSIEAFVVQQAGVSYYHLTGTYDANGVIKGDVDFGSFRDGLPTMPLGNRISGTLRGLIGAEGAIGAFIADSTGYSGGFIAVPNTVLGADTVAANYNDWIRSFNARPSIYLDTTARV
ncbi:MAG: hypothetical protein K8953_07750, partial [Proteobacteria bacterium]|nr:hypothetical protein [Pseudomonadota bacterium]